MSERGKRPRGRIPDLISERESAQGSHPRFNPKRHDGMAPKRADPWSMTLPVVAAVTVAIADVAADRHVPAGLSDPERSTVGGLSPSIREVTKSRGPACRSNG